MRQRRAVRTASRAMVMRGRSTKFGQRERGESSINPRILSANPRRNELRTGNVRERSLTLGNEANSKDSGHSRTRFANGKCIEESVSEAVKIAMFGFRETFMAAWVNWLLALVLMRWGNLVVREIFIMASGANGRNNHRVRRNESSAASGAGRGTDVAALSATECTRAETLDRSGDHA